MDGHSIVVPVAPVADHPRPRAATGGGVVEADPTVDGAFRSLAHWGFLARPDLPDTPGPAFLLVALRAQPSLTHFDPEVVRFWVTVDGRGRHAELAYDARFPVSRPFSWGTIDLIDRLAISNEYLTFGGDLAGAMVEEVAILVFISPAPLLRRGGHSQGWDEPADSLAAFFARMRVAVEQAPGFEADLAQTTPVTRYAAFVGELVQRYRASTSLRDDQPRRWTLLAGEERRLRRDHAADWEAGRRLAAELAAAVGS
jgi:hypothetical protein